MRGRPRLSEQEKAARGTLQKCRMDANRKIRDNEGILDYVPQSPEGLSEPVAQHWYNVCYYLAKYSVLTILDLPLLEMMCWEYEKYLKLCKVPKYQKEAGAALKNYMTIAVKYGVTAEGRNKLIRFVPPQQEEDPIKKLMEA